MEKTVSKKLNTVNRDDEQTQSTQQQKVVSPKIKSKSKKGPKTIIVDELPVIKGDPLSIYVPLKEEPKEAFDVKERIKHKDDIVVERYNPDIKKGLTIDEVEQRLMAGMSNISDTGSTKSISSIIASNILTFFNFLNFGIALWLISVRSGISQLLFLGVITLNIAIGIIQEIRAKKNN
jgi:cation-transporting P-type ATPase E